MVLLSRRAEHENAEEGGDRSRVSYGWKNAIGPKCGKLIYCPLVPMAGQAINEKPHDGVKFGLGALNYLTDWVFLITRVSAADRVRTPQSSGIFALPLAISDSLSRPDFSPLLPGRKIVPFQSLPLIPSSLKGCYRAERGRSHTRETPVGRSQMDGAIFRTHLSDCLQSYSRQIRRQRVPIAIVSHWDFSGGSAAASCPSKLVVGAISLLPFP